MDYEKKYKEALEKAHQLCAFPTSKPFISDLQDLFPELAESEDERIRKEIIDFISWATDRGSIKSEQREKSNSWIAWLEKQGEQESFDYEKAHIQQNDFAPKSALEAIKGEKLDNQTCVKPVDVRTIGYWHVEDVEQNPTAWSDEDERALGIIHVALEHPYNMEGKWDRKFALDWLKSLKDRVQPQQEWSKEDENIALGIEQLCNCASLLNIAPDKIDKIRTWLKSIKNRYTWKPSDEQMEALKNCCNGWEDNSNGILDSLYNDLKAL